MNPSEAGQEGVVSNKPLADLTLTLGTYCFFMNPRVASKEGVDPNLTLAGKIPCRAVVNPTHGRTREPPYLKDK